MPQQPGGAAGGGFAFAGTFHREAGEIGEALAQAVEVGEAAADLDGLDAMTQLSHASHDGPGEKDDALHHGHGLLREACLRPTANETRMELRTPPGCGESRDPVEKQEWRVALCEPAGEFRDQRVGIGAVARGEPVQRAGPTVDGALQRVLGGGRRLQEGAGQQAVGVRRQAFAGQQHEGAGADVDVHGVGQRHPPGVHGGVLIAGTQPQRRGLAVHRQVAEVAHVGRATGQDVAGDAEEVQQHGVPVAAVAVA